MSDWEQRLKLYGASASTSRQRSTSPVANGALLQDIYTSGGGRSEGIEGLAQQRAKSPNALERLRASTAMNLVALELRGQQGAAERPRGTSPSAAASIASSRTAAPREISGWGQGGAPSYRVEDEYGRTVVGTQHPSSTTNREGGVSYHRPSGAAAPTPRTSSPTLSQRSQAYATGTPKVALSSPYAVGSGVSAPRNASPQRNSYSCTGTPTLSDRRSPSALAASPSLVADSFNPQTILHMLESKIRALESRNQHLESAVQSLSTKNQELTTDLGECESRLNNQLALQGTVSSLQHEVDRLREELLAAAQREERRVEETRRRASIELDDERRTSAAREHEIQSLRSAIRQLANIERSVDH